MNDYVYTWDDPSFLFHCDSGHAWLEVNNSELAKIGLHRKDFSIYSYRHRDTLYLEEDCDAPIFIKKFEERMGHLPRIVELDEYNSKCVRNMVGLGG